MTGDVLSNCVKVVDIRNKHPSKLPKNIEENCQWLTNLTGKKTEEVEVTSQPGEDSSDKRRWKLLLIIFKKENLSETQAKKVWVDGVDNF